MGWFRKKQGTGGNPGRITAAELTQRLETDPNMVLVDVRELAEWEQGHIRKSLHIPLGSLEKRTGEIPRNSTVVTICRSGARSGRAAKMLFSAGFADVLNLEGGLMRWRGELER